MDTPDSAALFDLMQKMFTKEQLEFFAEAARAKNVGDSPTQKEDPPEPDPTTSQKKTQVVPKKIPSRSTSSEDESRSGTDDISMSDGKSNDGNLSGAGSWVEVAPATPKKRQTKDITPAKTPPRAQTKTQRDRVEKSTSPTKLMSGLILSSPLEGSSKKHKPTTSPKKDNSQKSRTTQKSTAAAKRLTKQIEKVTTPTVTEIINERKRFVVGVDFGTTFTSVSYYAHPVDDDNPRAFPSDIKVIMNWPKDGMGGARRQTPTEFWYSSVVKERVATMDQFEPTEFNIEVDMDEIDEPDEPTHLEEKRTYNDDVDMDDETSSNFLWGYQVPYQKFKGNSTRDDFRLIARPKLMLVNSKHTRDDRARLKPRLKSLIESGIIRKFTHREQEDPRDVQDAISDFLTEILIHTKEQLIDHAGFTSDCTVCFVLTVPVIWHPKSSRVLQCSLETAIRASGLGALDHGSVNDLFIIDEPEAAATYLLGSSHDILAGETFIVLDCGGGTVDCVTYTVTGDNCGASYLNDNFEKHLLKRLADETYLERDGETIQSIVRHLIPTFEDYDKRNRDINRKPSSRIKILGLKGDRRRGLTGIAAKRFEDNLLLMSPDDYNEIFLPLLRRVGHVLWSQIDLAVSKGKDVKKVFLIGGFGACPSLRSYLKDFLADTKVEFSLQYDIDLVTTTDQESVTAVSSGAVLRALDKKGGPARVARSSYGFLRIQQYEPDWKGHKDAEIETDPFDGEEYVRVIDYFMLKDETVPPVMRFPARRVKHAFDPDEKMICEELLYVSDVPIEYDVKGYSEKSHFHLKHSHNRDARVVGRILTDFTPLRDEGKIRHVSPDSSTKDGEYGGKDYDEIEYDLVAIVEGRNLRYEARYPAGAGGKAQKTGQISIAAAFEPGTG